MANNSGRFTPKTPKGGAPNAAAAGPRTPAYKTSGRYTPPVPVAVKHSARWVPYVMFGLLLLGLLVIILNYMELLPGAADNWYLVLGLASITGGFVTATQLR